MMEIILGLIGVILGLVIFYAGYKFGRRAEPVTEVRELTPEEKAKIEEEQRRFAADQKAFSDLLSYNVDVAYGAAVFGSRDK